LRAFPQAAWTGVIQIRDINDDTAAATLAASSKTFGTLEGKRKTVRARAGVG
jgi:hypothetical protein